MKYGNIIKKAAKFTLFSIVGTVFVFAGQLGQYSASLKDARMHAVSLWNLQNPNSEHVSQLFVRECLTSKMIGNAQISKQISGETKPVDIYECGNNVGAQDLVVAIRNTDQSMHTLAWPLSIFVN
ncbi:TPA: hypothetical protein AB5A43_003710 [Vibrio cholerae]